ncbi:MAG: hypothetical protein ACYDHY_16815 [Acidiferrobacterales bacterium]
MKAASMLLTAALIGASAPARAFLGIGDVSFDPQSYGELVSIYEQLQQSSVTLDSQLQTLQRLKAMAERAQQTYPRIRDTHYHALAGGLASPPGQAAGGLQAERARIEALSSGDPADAAAYRVELQQLAGLQQLQALQQAAAHNVARSATDLNGRASARVTAESTATLAALAAMAQQRRRALALQHAQARIDARGLVATSARIVRSLGSGP